MPVPTNNSRPSLPYVPDQSLPNNTRFGILTTTQRPPTAEMLDAEFNALTDNDNRLAGAINAAVAGNIPGSSDILNANKLVKTDGAGHLSWTYVTNDEIAPGAVVEQGIAAQAVTTPKIGNGSVKNPMMAPDAFDTIQIIDEAVTTGKIAAAAITTAKITPQAVTTPLIAPQAITAPLMNAEASLPGYSLISNGDTTATYQQVPTAGIVDGAITPPKIPLLAVDNTKINSGAARLGDVLTAGGDGSASFLANMGKVLQIVSYENRTSLFGQYDVTATQETPKSFQTGAFLIRITPRKTNSKIILFYSINVGAYRNTYISITLFKDGAPFKVGTGLTGYPPVTHSNNSAKGANDYSSEEYGCQNFSNLFVDTGIAGTEIVYEIKKSSQYANLNNGYTGGYPTISTMHAFEIDI